MEKQKTIMERVVYALDRRERRLSDLADFLNVGNSTVSAWKQRNSDPPAKFIAPMCEFLHVSMYWLLTGVEEPEAAAAALPPDEEKALGYYRRLSEENKDIAKGKMVELYQSQQDMRPDTGKAAANS